jgi:putative PIN family toxin of toxin-antitoxin system
MKIVLDANIFISAFYWGGNSELIINRVIEGLDELYFSKEILDEINDVMARPNFETDQVKIDNYIKRIENIGKKIIITGKIQNVCRDNDDNDKLECGIESDAEYLITGDKDLLVLDHYENITIVKPKEYLDIINNDK